MKTFEQFLSEGKKVGTVYHFTDLESFISILQDQFVLKAGKSSDNLYVSFTRNYRLQADRMFFFDSIVRVVIDGDKMSNKYKIDPFCDVYGGIDRSDKECEERIVSKYVDTLQFIKQVDILIRKDNQSIKNISKIINMMDRNYKNVKLNIVEKWRPVK